MSFGEFLKMKRESKKPKMSMRKLARLANIDASYVSRLEDEKEDKNPSKQVVKNIAKALNEDEDEFLIMAGYVPENPERARKVYSGEELEEKIPEEYKDLFKNENLKYIKFAKKMLKEEISPEALVKLAKIYQDMKNDEE